MATRQSALEALAAQAAAARARRRADRRQLRDGMRDAVSRHGALHSEVAEAVGMSRPTVTQILAGNRWAADTDAAL